MAKFTMTDTSKFQNILRRFLAILIDLTFITLVIVIIYTIITKIWITTYISLFIDQNIEETILVILFNIIIPYLYFDIQEIKNGTIGKRIMNIYIHCKDGTKCKSHQIFLRNFFNIYIFPINLILMAFFDINFFSKYVFIINVLLILFTPSSLSLGDLLAKTRVTYDKKYYKQKWPKCLKKRNIIKIFSILLILYFVISIIPPKLYIEEIVDTTLDRESYVFTKNKPMTDQQVFDLIIEYDANNTLIEYDKIETEEQYRYRYYFPSQYEYSSLMGTSDVTLSKKQKEELSNYTFMSEEFNRPIPVIVTYDYLTNRKSYYWYTEKCRYEKFYPFYPLNH